jgi:hypothetical protein
MIWSKQFFYYEVPQWLKGDPAHPKPHEWAHLNNADVISMPDKWEYPWYAARDLAFHTVSLALIDPEFARQQLVLSTREWYMHPNGQMPAYEWAFGDMNPRSTLGPPGGSFRSIASSRGESSPITREISHFWNARFTS